MTIKVAAGHNVLNSVAQGILCWLLFVIRMTLFVHRRVNFSTVLVPVLKQDLLSNFLGPVGKKSKKYHT